MPDLPPTALPDHTIIRGRRGRGLPASWSVADQLIPIDSSLWQTSLCIAPHSPTGPDPQGTATRWAAAAPDGMPFPAAVGSPAGANGGLHRELRKFLAAFDYIVVDCPPSANSPLSQSALLVADLALVPVIPSPPDLWAGVAPVPD